MRGEWVSSCVPYRTEEAASRRRKGGEAGLEEETSARGGWLGLESEGADGIKSLSGIRHFSVPICQPLPFPFACFHTTSGPTLSFLLFVPLFNSSSCLYSMSNGLSSSSFIVLYLSSARSFRGRLLCVCFLAILSPLHGFAGKELGVRSVPVPSTLCYPTRRVGVKHRQWRSEPGRWHRTECDSCRES